MPSTKLSEVRGSIFFSAVLALSGCKTLKQQSNVLEASSTALNKDCTNGLSDIGQAAYADLKKKSKLQFWDLSCNNALSANWLILTPNPDTWALPKEKIPVMDTCDDGPDCDKELHMKLCQTDSDCTKGRCMPAAYSTGSVCAGHSNHLFSEVYDVIAKAKTRVDISTLGAPDDPYRFVMRRALVAAKRNISGQGRLDFRLLGTGVAAESERIAKVFAIGVIDPQVDPAASPVEIGVGMYGTSRSWNHSKIVVADGADAIVGGHNWWAADYNRDIPLFDASVRIRGRAALAAQRYLDMLWKTPRYVKNFSTPVPNKNAGILPPVSDEAANAVNGNIRVLAVGTDGGLARGWHPGASDVALISMMNHAKKSIDISQMELVSPLAKEKHTEWDYPQFLSKPVVDGITDAALRGVKVRIIISSNDPSDSISASYSHGWTLQKDASEMKKRMLSQLPRKVKDADAINLLCQNIQLAYIRRSTAEEPNLNHAKVLAVDDKIFYVGSQNLYPGGMADKVAPQLAEFGWIIDDQPTATLFMKNYYEKLWANSARTSVSGGEKAAGECAFRL